MANIDINNASLYKSCRKKLYEIWCCKPPIGTCVINKLEQADVVKQLGGRTWFSAEELVKLSRTNPQMFSYLKSKAYIVDANKRYVLSGTLGELWTIDFGKLCSRYTTADGLNLNIALSGKEYYCTMVHNDTLGADIPTPSEQTLESFIKSGCETYSQVIKSLLLIMQLKSPLYVPE